MDKLNEEIARVAYDLYEKRGRVEGSHFDDWVEAEKIVLAMRAERTAKPAAKKRAARTPKEKDVTGAGKAAQKKRTTARKTTASKKTT